MSVDLVPGEVRTVAKSLLLVLSAAPVSTAAPERNKNGLNLKLQFPTGRTDKVTDSPFSELVLNVLCASVLVCRVVREEAQRLPLLGSPSFLSQAAN